MSAGLRWRASSLREESGDLLGGNGAFANHAPAVVDLGRAAQEAQPGNVEARTGEREVRIKILLHTMDFALRLLHPFMPFVTEEIWQTLPGTGVSGGQHQAGTCRMGNDPKTSVLNAYCQTHDVKNVFVTDGAPLVTNPDKNPTLTIMALSWRASEYLIDQV